MGAMESSVGFYNDRKIIRYENGTFEYPGLEAIPFGQKEERAKAFIRIQNSEDLKEHYRALPPSLAMDPDIFRKFLAENPEYIEAAQETSDYLESIASSSSSNVRSRRKKSNKVTPRTSSGRVTSDDEDTVSLFTSSAASTTEVSTADSWSTESKRFKKKLSWDCTKNCGILSRFREYRRNRVQDVDLVYERICSATDDMELNPRDLSNEIQEDEKQSLFPVETPL
ncbi:unnamed protein product [Allacma fusca]|uniref:Uncharacterized protein n=1 Tax=Allacma fusca TaxID=39272 RepID=A0A8J2KBP1_9HEXA|nr:unnamed protein product [Allacma fusca]